MKKISVILLCITFMILTACSADANDTGKLNGDEKDAFAAVEKYYKATGQLDIRTCLEAVFPEALEKQLEEYNGSIDEYVKTVETLMASQDKIDVEVKFLSIDRDKYGTSSDFNKEAESLASVYGINKAGVEKIVNIEFELIYTEDGEENTDRKNCDVCKYNGNWYLSPKRSDNESEETEAGEDEEISYPEALEKAIDYVQERLDDAVSIEIIDAPSEDGIMEQSEDYSFLAIIDNDFYEAVGGTPYQSLEIHGVSDNNYVVFTGKFFLTDDGDLAITVTAELNDGSVLGNDSQILHAVVKENSKSEGNAVRFKVK